MDMHKEEGEDEEEEEEDSDLAFVWLLLFVMDGLLRKKDLRIRSRSFSFFDTRIIVPPAFLPILFFILVILLILSMASLCPPLDDIRPLASCCIADNDDVDDDNVLTDCFVLFM